MIKVRISMKFITRKFNKYSTNILISFVKLYLHINLLYVCTTLAKTVVSCYLSHFRNFKIYQLRTIKFEIYLSSLIIFPTVYFTYTN